MVDGTPVGKQRARFRKAGAYVQAYTPAKTKAFEERVKWAFLNAGGVLCDMKPVSVSILAVIQPPTSWSKKKKMSASSGEIKPTVRPDLDNYIKSVLDGLNGVAYTDDKQVCEIVARKEYGTPARCEVEVEEMPESEGGWSRVCYDGTENL